MTTDLLLNNSLLSVVFAFALMIVLRLGFRYGNPLPKPKTLEERLSPKMKTVFMAFGLFVVFSGLIAIFYSATLPNNVLTSTPDKLIQTIKQGGEKTLNVLKPPASIEN